MRQIFLAYNQIVKIRINIVGLKNLLRGGSKAEIVLSVNKGITTKDYQVKRETINSKTFDLLNRPIVHTFPVLEYSDLEKPIMGNFWTLDVYLDGKFVLERERSGAILCQRKHYVERYIADLMYRFLNYQVKFLGGPNNPDLILKDPLCDSEIQCEITEKTNSENELTYEKFSSDVEKYEKYKRENRFSKVKHLLIIPCSDGIHHSIRKHIRDFVTILTFNDFYNILCSLKMKKNGINNEETVKNMISNPGIQKAPRIHYKIVTPFMKEKSMAPYVLDLRQKSSENKCAGESLLYIRDINPFEVIKIVGIAKEHKDDYLSTTKFKQILLQPANLQRINQKRPEASIETSRSRIYKEWWLITPIQLGYLDQDCKVTDKGQFLLELVEKRDLETVRKSMGYDFLNAQGVKEFLKLANKVYADPFYQRAPSQASFYQVLSRRINEAGLSSCEANARKDCDNLFRWLRIFGYSDKHAINVERIKEDYMLE